MLWNKFVSLNVGNTNMFGIHSSSALWFSRMIYILIYIYILKSYVKQLARELANTKIKPAILSNIFTVIY